MSSVRSQGKALITGASSGIGAVYAERLAARGFDLLLVARDEERLHVAANTLQASHSVQVEVLKSDLTSRSDLLEVERRLRNDRDISLLLNNAGVAADGPLAAADLDQMEQMIQLNVVALLPERFNATYSATKAYVLSLSQSLQAELKGTGVQVQAVLPGVTRTEIWQRAGFDVSVIPAEMVMDAGEMVDAALSGFDQRVLITLPSLPDAGDWQAMVAARLALAPNLSRSSAAARYK